MPGVVEGRACLSGIAVRSVSCGAYHTAAVGEQGDLFCWGWQLEGSPTAGGSLAGAPLVEGYATLPQRVDALVHARVRALASLCSEFLEFTLQWDCH